MTKMDSAHNTVQTETFNISAGSRNFLEANFSLRADWAMKEQRMCQEHCNVKMRWRGLEGGPRLGRQSGFMNLVGYEVDKYAYGKCK